MGSREYSFGLRIGYILVSLVMVIEVGDDFLLYLDPLQYAMCNICFIKSLIMLIIVITGFVLIYKGMKVEHPDNQNSIVLGIVLLVLAVVLDVVVFFNSGGIEGVLRLGGKKVVFWVTARTLINLVGIFFIVHTIHTPKRKKILAAVLGAVFILSTLNMIFYYPKMMDYYEDMEDFMEGEEEQEKFNYFMEESNEPTVKEMLEKYDEEKKPLLVHIIIKNILELIIAFVFFSSVFFNRDDYDEYDEYDDNSYESERSWRRY